MTLEHELEQLRQQAVLASLYQRYPNSLRASLVISEMQQQPDLQITGDTLRRVLGYLHDRGQIDLVRGDNITLVRILPLGVDAVESQPNNARLREHNRMLRLRVLSALNALRPDVLGEGLILAYLRSDEDLDLAPPAIPRALAYLSQCGLAGITHNNAMARILPDGVDYLLGQGKDLPGVARPAA